MDQIIRLLQEKMLFEIDIVNVVFSLLLAAAIGVVISQVYKYTHRGLNFELFFMTTLVVLAPIVSIVMLFIRGDLVLSLGLIGSLSIIRFRTPIKDTRDMVFLFWTIATGLGCGTYNWGIVIIASIIITILVFVLYFMRYGQVKRSDFVLVIGGIHPYDAGKVGEVIGNYLKDCHIRSKESEENHWEIIYEIRSVLPTCDMTDSLIADLKKINGVTRVSLLAPQIALPV